MRRMLIFLTMLVAFARPDHAAALDLDRDFGERGVATILFGRPARAEAMAVQPDGAILVAATVENGRGTRDLGLARLLPDGALDRAFGDHGLAIVDLLGTDEYASALAIQLDGKLVLAASANGDFDERFVVARFDPDGALDAGFGEGGWTTVASDQGGLLAYSVAIAPDGGIIVGGTLSYYTANGTGFQFALARLHPNGAVSHGFGDHGLVVTPSTGIGSELAVLPDGGIVLAGPAYGLTANAAVARYDRTGWLVAGHGQAGVAYGGGGSYGIVDGMVVLPDGGVLLALAGDCDSRVPDPAQCPIVLVGLTPSGAIAPGFDADAERSTGVIGGEYDGAALVTTDDALFLIGNSQDRITVAGLRPDGSPDPDYPAATLAVTGRVAEVAPDDDGGLLIAGGQPPENATTVFLARVTVE